MDVIKVFNKSEYAGPLSERIQHMLEKLAVLGKAVIAGRGDGFSANISGTIYVGEDGGDPVLRGKKPPQGECDCHVHVRWDQIRDFALKQEDVGYGPEAVIYLLGEDGKPILRIFYPDRTYAEVETALAGTYVRRVETAQRPFRVVFMIRFPSEKNLNAYVEFWHQISRVVQKEAGALRTRLHRIRGSQPAVLAIAEWESYGARVFASQHLNNTMQIDAMVSSRIAELGGELSIVAEADEIAVVLP